MDFQSSENISVLTTLWIQFHELRAGSKVVVDISLRMEHAALYVACSRATKASGLFLIGNFKPPKPLALNDKVFKEIQLQKSKKLVTHYDHMINKTDFQILYHNVQSLHGL